MRKQTQPSTDDTVTEVVPEAAGTKWLGEEANKGSAELVVPRVFSDEDLSEVDSWDTMLSFVDGAFGEAINGADVLGTGFRIADEDAKLKLCDVPLMFMQWMFYPGDYGRDFVAVYAIQRYDNGSIAKWIITDGGLGLCQELKAYTKKTGRSGGLGFPKGLRVSNYYIDADSKSTLTKAEVAEYISSGRKPVPAHTFYVNTSA